VLIFSSPASAQFISARAIQSPRSQALLGSDVASPSDALAANPAADSVQFVAMMYIPTPLAIEGAWSASVSSLYALDNLNRVGAAVIANAFQDKYSDQITSVQYARAIPLRDSGRSIVGGVRLKYSSEHFGNNYQPLNALTADVGIRFSVLDNLTAGIALSDLGTVYRNQDVSAATRTAFAGLSWRALDDVTIHAAVSSPQGSSASVLAGIECNLEQHIAVRAGAETAIGELAAGVGLHYTNLQLDLSVVRHPLLGSTLSFGLQYGW
jgi:hypothetical protein